MRGWGKRVGMMGWGRRVGIRVSTRGRRVRMRGWWGMRVGIKVWGRNTLECVGVHWSELECIRVS